MAKGEDTEGRLITSSSSASSVSSASSAALSTLSALSSLSSSLSAAVFYLAKLDSNLTFLLFLGLPRFPLLTEYFLKNTLFL